MGQYWDMKKRHQQEFNEFPMFFAFTKNSFAEGMKRLGLSPEDTDRIYHIGGGGYIRRSDNEALEAMLKRHQEELEAAIEADPTGDGFIYDMFYSELCNHEFCITFEIEDTLDALGLDMERIEGSRRLTHGLHKAMRQAGRES